MSSKYRYCGGDCKPRLFKTDPLFPIEEGDLVFYHHPSGCIRSATHFINQGSAADNQDAFQQSFAGVCLYKIGLQPGETSFRPTTDVGYALVATAGEFEYECNSHQWAPGDLVGIYATTLACSPQKVATAASASLAIGQAAPGIAGLANAMTRVVVSIVSTMFGGGIQNQVSGSGSGQ